MHWTQDDSCPWWDGAGQGKSYHTFQKGTQFKIHESFISGKFHSAFWAMVDLGWLKPQKIKPWMTRDCGTSYFRETGRLRGGGYMLVNLV